MGLKNIKINIVILMIMLLAPQISYAKETVMTSNEIKQLVKEIFSNTVENMNATEETYARYFSKDYIQYVDGKMLNYDDFVAHMKAQKMVIKSAKITFKHILVEGDKVATVHVVDAIKQDGNEVKAQVNALFQIKDKKVVLCDELTHLIKGDKSDRDLGSRH